MIDESKSPGPASSTSGATPQYSEIVVFQRAGILSGQCRSRLPTAIEAADLQARPGARA